VDGNAMLDLCYEEDSRADVDFNVVMTGEGKYVEVQGTAEHGAFDRNAMNALLELAEKGIRDSFAMQRNVLAAVNLPAL
jgi:ribonuclease PH